MAELDYDMTIENQTQNVRMTWTLPGFSGLCNGTTKELRSDEAQYSTTKDPRFQLKIQFNGMFNDLIEIYFKSPKPAFLKYQLNIPKTSRYSDMECSKDYHVVHAHKWQYVCIIYKKYIHEFVVRHSLTLNFSFTEPCNLKVNVTDVQLSKDYENLLDSGIFSDVTMKSAEAIEYKVHKVVLACRSQVLKAHFEHNTTECISNVVESPLESEVLQEVITFMYTDKTSRVDEIPEKLLAAAEYYQLIKLKGLCEVALHKKLNLENAIETLQLADHHSASDLKQWTLAFIKDNQGKLITKSEGWVKLESVHLFKLICEYIMENAEPCEDIGNTTDSQEIFTVENLPC